MRIIFISWNWAHKQDRASPRRSFKLGIIMVIVCLSDVTIPAGLLGWTWSRSLRSDSTPQRYCASMKATTEEVDNCPPEHPSLYINTMFECFRMNDYLHSFKYLLRYFVVAYRSSPSNFRKHVDVCSWTSFILDKSIINPSDSCSWSRTLLPESSWRPGRWTTLILFWGLCTGSLFLRE